MNSFHDTIYALSTPMGRSAVAVVRLSGPHCLTVARRMAGRTPEPNRAFLAGVKDPDTGRIIDKALVLYFGTPRSFTGEDCLEFHLHGSPAVIREMLEVLSRQDGLRMAEPGEFTRRAWLNEKMDMAEAEALKELIDAETRAQKVKALSIMSGALERQVESWRRDMIEGLSYLEVSIDFVDEDDIGEATAGLAIAPLEKVLGSMRKALAGAEAGLRLSSGLQVVLVGVPNAGKSSLLNDLARRDVAIVTEVPGTTRDILEVFVEMDGLPIVFRDTAGLRETEDRVELIGVRRAQEALAAADLVVLFVNEANRAELRMLEDLISSRDQGSVMRVMNKCDLMSAELLPKGAMPISVKSGEGMTGFRQEIVRRAQELMNPESVIGSERQRVALSMACSELALALDVMSTNPALTDIAAEHVHLAERYLQRMMGRIDVEDVLDRIFSSFCIGK